MNSMRARSVARVTENPICPNQDVPSGARSIIATGIASPTNASQATEKNRIRTSTFPRTNGSETMIVSGARTAARRPTCAHASRAGSPRATRAATA
jgi:hypothetical protein